MTLRIITDEKTKEFSADEREEFKDMQALLDEQGVDYDVETEDTPVEPESDESGSEGMNGRTEPDPPQNANAGVSSEYEYLTEHMGVPDVFITQLKGGSYHVDKTGYYHLADQQGISFTVEPLNPTYEGDDETSVWLGRAIDASGREYANVGTAHLSGENMGGAEYNLDELAATRAACRVLSMATGVGSTATEEMPNE